MTRALPAEHVAQGSFTVHTRGRGFSDTSHSTTNITTPSSVISYSCEG